MRWRKVEREGVLGCRRWEEKEKKVRWRKERRGRRQGRRMRDVLGSEQVRLKETHLKERDRGWNIGRGRE